MKGPLVSIIIPNYNHSPYLKQRIDSVLEQLFQDFELIILDDCSTDDSRSIIDKYSSSNKISQIIFNEYNSGSTFLQWKKGFFLAKGKYIWIAESDDYADTSFLEKLVPLLEDNPDCNIAFSESYAIDEYNNILPDDWDRNKGLKSSVSEFDGKAFVRARMLFNNSIYNASMALFRKAALTYIDDRFMDFKYCGDWYFWNKVCFQGSVIRYNEKLNYFRQHAQKVTPKAEAEGKRFIEGKYVIEDMVEVLNLTPIQKKVIVGRLMKYIVSFKHFKTRELKNDIIEDVAGYLGYGRSSIFIYELDKILNFSRLDIKKSRYL
ncbi:glycosyltransferase [Dysgonomonas sp. Marseille-P4677]|uniref:glycosyltransferase family 2 protein n=1 Tax=Dysgonomonas sp. Marseille-P4677 TaxID=2364790 RepID=UPI00191204F0|nr:glycosyltransferase [Dysgonomonas sp. Marseille-P4677]MBK5721224.1 glycosyltransferase [Dysgonomonas sp. Marseille-P4677]